MKPDRKLEPLARLIADLIESQDPNEGDRMLLDAVFTLQAARAAAIWRRTGESGWRAIVERGPSETLPASSLIEAVLEGALSSDCLPPRRAILRAGSDRGAIALVLAEVEDQEDRLDVLEALLHVRRALAGVGLPLQALELPPRPRKRGPGEPPGLEA